MRRCSRPPPGGRSTLVPAGTDPRERHIQSSASRSVRRPEQGRLGAGTYCCLGHARRGDTQTGFPTAPSRPNVSRPDGPLGPGGDASARLAEASRSLRTDRTALVAALGLAFATFALVALGLAIPTNGGLLRFTPLVTLLLAPVTAALLVVRPWSGLCIWMILMPLMNVAQVQVFVGWEQIILTTALLAALLVGTALEHGRRDPAVDAPPTDVTTRVVWVALSLLALLTAASTLLTPSLMRSVPIAQHGFLEPLLLLGVVLWLRPGWTQLTQLLASLGVSVAIASVLSLARMLLRFAQTLDQFEAQREQLSRLVYFNVGIFGNLLAMALPLLLAWLLLRRRGFGPRLSYVIVVPAIVVSLLCLYLTFSKSGWLGGIVGCAGLFALTARTWRARIATVVVAMALVSFVIPYPQVLIRLVSPSAASIYSGVVTSINSRAATIDTESPEGEVSVTERLLATKAALHMAIDHPVLGVGPGSFAAEYATAYSAPSATRALDSAHDFLPYVAAEFGLIVGGLVALGLAAGLLGAILTYLRAPPGEVRSRLVAAAVASAIAAFIVVGTTFGVDLYRPYRTMNSDVVYAALLVAAGIMLPRTARGGREASPREPVDAFA